MILNIFKIDIKLPNHSIEPLKLISKRTNILGISKVQIKCWPALGFRAVSRPVGLMKTICAEMNFWLLLLANEFLDEFLTQCADNSWWMVFNKYYLYDCPTGTSFIFKGRFFDKDSPRNGRKKHPLFHSCLQSRFGSRWRPSTDDEFIGQYSVTESN